MTSQNTPALETGVLYGLTAYPANPVLKTQEEYRAKVFHPKCLIEGWFLPPTVGDVRGIRAIHRGSVIVARRKHLRADVYHKFPWRKDALDSGFKVPLILRPGTNKILLQYKNSAGQWLAFCHCELRLPRLWRLMNLWAKRVPQNEYEHWVALHETVTPEKRKEMLLAIAAFPARPLISVLMPTYNTPERWLQRVIESVTDQVYPHWELCIADDCSPQPHVRRVLEKAANADSRIKLTFREKNGHICHASNSALALCTGEFTALLDHDDELPPDALFHVVDTITRHPEVDLLFSDEDKIDEHGTRSDPYFKPGWNPELFLYENCFSHLGVFRTSLLREIGGFRPGLEGSQDWDLTLRAIGRVPADHVRHIPRVLYHWRTLETSTAASMTAKPYAATAGMRAVADHLASRGTGGTVESTPDGYWRIIWPLPTPPPLVSIIIPTRDRVDLLKTALDSLFDLTEYPCFEVIIVDHASEQQETKDYLDSIVASHDRVAVVRAEGPFNWSQLNNVGAAKAAGEILLFLNNDVEITNAGWLRELAALASRTDVGAVGACLLYPGGNIQHAGVVLGMSGLAGHVFRHATLRHPSIGGQPWRVREVTAVTGACLAVRRSLFDEVGGFDAEHLPISYNDLDFCLRLRARGMHNLYTPHACLVHHESVSRASLEKESARKAAATQEARIMLNRWPAEFVQDAFYNPRLSLASEWPSLP